MFLNGVKESQVKKLVEKYDINGDGKISYDEFLQLLTSRGAIDEYDDISITDASSSRNSDRSSHMDVNFDRSKASKYKNQPNLNNYLRNKDYDVATDADGNDGDNVDNDFFESNQQVDVEDIRPQLPRPKAKAMVAKDADMISVASSRLSDLNIDNPKDFEYRVKIFLDSLKTHLVKQATQLRMSGGVDDSLVRMKASEFHESTARMMVTKAFQKYTGGGLV